MTRIAATSLRGLSGLCVFTATMQTAWATDPAAPSRSAATPGSDSEAVTVRVVGFVDADPSKNCPPTRASALACIEEVSFLEVPRPLPGELNEAQRAELALLARLYGRVWDGLALRWNDEGDSLVGLFQSDGPMLLPSPAQLWEASTAAASPRYALPDAALWLDAGTWVPQAGAQREPAAPAFPAVQVQHPRRLPAPPPLVRLSGRFADGIRKDNLPYPYDLMDADAELSSPFFEQLFPFDRAIDNIWLWLQNQLGGSRTVCAAMHPLVADLACPPLWRLEVPATFRNAEGDATDGVTGFSADQWRPILFDEREGIDGMQREVSAAFEAFYLRVGSSITRYAAEEFSETHLRALGALLAMHSAPEPAESSAGDDDRTANASNSGETDDRSLIEQTVKPAFARQSTQGQLQIDALPDEVVQEALRRMGDIIPASTDATFLARLDARARAVLTDNLGSDCPPMEGAGLDLTRLDSWARRCARGGQEATVRQIVRQIALDEVLTLRGTGMQILRDLEEQRLLLRHVETQIIPVLSAETEGGEALAPRAVQELVAAEWISMLKAHGYEAEPAQQLPGATNALAVCSTQRGTAALDDASWRRVALDLIMTAPAGSRDVDEVLWQAREQIPFLLVDGPPAESGAQTGARPELTALATLPDGRALYRVRWHLWSGWHILWGQQAPVDQPASRTRRVYGLTAAICEDTVLAPPTLAATLVRAGLLDAPMRSTALAPAATDGEQNETAGRPKDEMSSDEAVAAADDAAQQITREGEAGLDAASTAREDPSALADKGDDAADFVEDLNQKRGGQEQVTETEAAAYLRRLVRKTLDQIAPQGQLLLVVFDLAANVPTARTWRLRPDTPYDVAQRRTGGGQASRGASWALTASAASPTSPWRVVAPDHVPTESVKLDTAQPRWRRQRQVDFWLSGAPMLGWRHAHLTCIASNQRTSDCEDLILQPEDTLPIGFELSGAATLWLDRPRLGLHVGPLLQVTPFPNGPDVLGRPEEDEIPMTYPRGELTDVLAGVEIGLRRAPEAWPLWRFNATRYPWGADHDARSRLVRVQQGLTLSGLIEAGYEGTRGVAGVELWQAWSIRRPAGPQASLTPYRPAFLLGPSIQAQYTSVLSYDTVLPTGLDDRWQVSLQLQGQLRLGGGTPKPPEAP